MREILFRAKTTDGKWVCGDLLQLSVEGKDLCGIKEHDLLHTPHLCDSKTVGQYTGLTDKNGKKIFEGDIVSHQGYKREYYAKVAYGEFNCDCCNGVYGWTFDDGDIREVSIYTVVGNIYDNPELLEGTA